MDFLLLILAFFLILFPFEETAVSNYKIFNIKLAKLLQWSGCALVALNVLLLLFN